MSDSTSNKRNAAKIAYTAALWTLTAAGCAALVYCFGGFSKLTEVFIELSPDDGPEGEGLGIAFIQIFLILSGTGIAGFFIPRIIGAVGFTVKSAKRAEKKNGFIITSAVPCIPNALLYAFCAFLSYNYFAAVSAVFIILSLCEAAFFAASLIIAFTSRKTRQINPR